MKQVMETLAEGRIIAIVRGIPSEKIGALAQALFSGGVTMMEVTFDQTRPDSWQDTCRAIELNRPGISGKSPPRGGHGADPGTVNIGPGRGGEIHHFSGRK